jgi:alkylation response protein AidB-like acyl-CoA dehydrogenase
MLHPWITECAPAQVPPFINMVGCVLTGAALLAFGTPEQRSEHLRPIITGERIWCQLFSEPGPGSDLARLRTGAS